MTSSPSWIALLPPGLLLVLGGLALPLVGDLLRRALVLGLPLLALALIWQLPDATPAALAFLDYALVPVQADALSRLFATIFAIMAFAGGLFALDQSRPGELAAAFVYAGSAIGVTFAGDLVTLFVFWEVMALASTLVLWSGGPRAGAAGLRYVLIHLLGGVVLMTGIVAHVAQTGSIAFSAMSLDTAGAWLILAGFLLNAGAPPLSAWLPDAYPEASPAGMVFLSAFTTKTAVYVLLRGFAGAEILIFFGLYMVFYGIVYALLENDMRRILAYSIVNQVGFMVTGIGIGTPAALNGAASHAFTHIIYKALLLMSAGAVLHMTGKRKCSDLGGLYKSMPLTALFGIVGALSISAFPLTSGFVSKSLISEAAADQGLALVCSPPPRPASSCTPASSFPGSSSSRRIPVCGRRSRRPTCCWPWPSSPRSASASASTPIRSTRCCPSPSTMSPIPARMCSRSCSCCCTRASPSSSCCRRCAGRSPSASMSTGSTAASAPGWRANSSCWRAVRRAGWSDGRAAASTT
jgi:multicomponent Na+:H+ antiporter subunit D